MSGGWNNFMNGTKNRTFLPSSAAARPKSSTSSSYSKKPSNPNPKPSSTSKQPWTNKNSHNLPAPHAPFDPVLFESKLQDVPAPSSRTTAQFLGFTTAIYDTDPSLRLLNPQQRSIVTAVIFGQQSCFFTGPAGTGKTKVLSAISRLNALAIRPRKIVVTATTGIAACAISGTTVHAFAGVGLGNDGTAKMEKHVMGNEFTKKRWRSTDVLIIDEVSMMEGGFLDKLDAIGRRTRGKTHLPFGGMQLVLCGDFFQLPPVSLLSGFAFEAKCWNENIKKSVLLTHVYRQGGDPQLIDVLSEARVGALSDKSRAILQNHVDHPPPPPPTDEDDCAAHKDLSPLMSSLNPPQAQVKSAPMLYTRLECKNVDVDSQNARELNKLGGQQHEYQAHDFTLTDFHKGNLKHNPASEVLKLKQSAQVMLLKNIDPDAQLVNGARGVVVGFTEAAAHKTLNPDFTMPRSWPDNAMLPIVQFAAMGEKAGGLGARRVITPESWENKVEDTVVASRQQIPLRLAWALSVHKSQGMTIPLLEVGLKGVFEYGQGYVALSRATQLSTMRLRDFDANSFRAHPTVVKFYNVLEKVQLARSSKAPPTPPSSPHFAKTTTVTSPASSVISNSYSGSHKRQLDNAGSAGGGLFKKNKVVLKPPRPPERRSSLGQKFVQPKKSAASAPAATKSGAGGGLTEEQKRKMEENRRKAVEKQKMRQQQQQQQQQP